LFTAALVLAAAGVFAGTAVAGASVAPAWTPGSDHRHAGSLDAVLSFERRPTGYGSLEYRRLTLVVQNAGKTVFDHRLCTPERCGPGSQAHLKLQNVWGSSLDEVLIDLYTGGAHCCFESLIVLADGAHPGRLLFRNWGDPGFRGQRHDGSFEFISADDRFAYSFTAFAGSGLPVQVWTIDAAGRFADVTSTRLDLVRAEAKQWWHAYVSERKKADSDARGVVAAWCADEYRLGLKEACTAELSTAVTKGYLHGSAGWPQDGAFVKALERSLAKWGYGAG
jgi:hypothetical protein